MDLAGSPTWSLNESVYIEHRPFPIVTLNDLPTHNPPPPRSHHTPIGFIRFACPDQRVAESFALQYQHVRGYSSKCILMNSFKRRGTTGDVTACSLNSYVNSMSRIFDVRSGPVEPCDCIYFYVVYFAVFLFYYCYYRFVIWSFIIGLEFSFSKRPRLYDPDLPYIIINYNGDGSREKKAQCCADVIFLWATLSRFLSR